MIEKNEREARGAARPAERPVKREPQGAAQRRATGRAPKRRRRRRARNYLARRLMLLAIALVAVGALLCAGLYFSERLNLNLRLRREVYPVRYEEFIRASAEENAIPPAYIAAVILAESSYDAQAVSYADARGLMQLLPSTAVWIAGRLGESDTYTEEALFDPETNIRYGSWYLGFLMNRYNGDMRCSTAAYHAGQGTVDNWLSDARYSEDGQTLAVIASNATNTYVSRVLKNYEKYSEIYKEEI